MNDSIEKAIAAAVGIVFDDIFELKDQISKMQRTPGPKGDPGEMTPVEQVATYLLENFPDQIRGEKGSDGQPGKNANPPSIYEIASEVKADPEFLRQCRPNINMKDLALALLEHGADELRGPAGKDAPQITVEDVTDALKADAEFVASAKGEKGDTPTTEEFVDLFFQKYGESVRGEPGKDAPPITLDDVREALKSDEEFVTKAKGERGEKGEKGDKGDQGESPDAEALIDTFFEKYGERVRGEPGKDVDVETLLKKFKDDSDFIASLKGPKGDTGERGEVGAGIEAPRWTKGVYREGVTVQHYVGRYYRAIRDTADEPGKSDDWERVGSGGFRFYPDGESIDKSLLEDGDIFTGRGSSFIWLGGKAHTLALVGERGAAGKDGEAGKPGKDAPTIVAGELTDKSLVLAMSDGSLVECDSTSFIKNIQSAFLQVHEAALEQERLSLERRGTPMNVFCGTWVESKSYQRGDVVSFSNALWSCKAASSSNRFNPDDWSRMLALPTGKQKTKVSLTSNVARIPSRKKAGQNLRSCTDIVTDGELNQYEIQVWHESEVIMPVVRLCTFDPTVLAKTRHVHVEAIHIHNHTLGVMATDPNRKALLDDAGFALSADAIAINSKLISTVSIDRRNPDFDLVTIESRYRNASGDMMRYSVSAWTDKVNPFSFIGFGAEGDDGSHWRAFQR